MSATQNRRLAAIVFTDMVGYTALMQEDESAARQKRERHRQVLKEEHDRFGGEIIQYFGDGTLSIFSDTSNAVQCAIAIQRALKVPVEVPLRIGIHAGSIIVEEDGILGDAVNIASRIESFANVGGIFISDTVFDQVKNQKFSDFIPLGQFHLKNIERRFEIFAIAAEGIKVPDATFLQGKGEKITSFKVSLPKPAAPLLGREVELERLISMLREHRILTITGTGGIGKTRLSLEICQRVKSEFKNNIAFFSMATLDDATRVMPTVATALGITETTDRDVVDGVAAFFGDNKSLLVLDNLEHVTDAADEIAGLVSKCPNLRVINTSRTPLKIKAEYEFPLRTLDIPVSSDLSELIEYPIIKLFVARAQKVNPDFTITGENASAILGICERLDGLPLAVELAAARVRILAPDKLLTRLNRALDVLTSRSTDLPERHRTLRSTIDWSYSLLDDPEKKLFRRLSVFVGGFTMEAVEEVCYTDEEDSFLAIDELESLVNKGLLQLPDPAGRFTFLQTIKDYSLELLTGAGEREMIYERHGNYFSRLSDALEAGVPGPDQISYIHQGVREESNIQASLDYFLEKTLGGDDHAREMGLRICGNLWLYWHIRGKHLTAKNYINSFFEAYNCQIPTVAQCNALFHLHVATFTLGEIESSRKVGERMLETALILGDEKTLGKANFALGFGNFLTDVKKAKEYGQISMDKFRKIGNKSWLAYSCWQNGIFNLVSGDLDKSKACYSESLDLFQSLKDSEGIGCALSGLAMLDFIAGRYKDSIEKYNEALVAFRSVGDRPEEARILSEISWTYLATKNTDAARKSALESVQVSIESGSMRGVGLAMNGLAAIEAVEGRPRNAIEIAAAARQLAEVKGVAIELGVNNHGKVYLDKAIESLSEDEIAMAEQKGKNLSVSDIIEMTNNELIAVV